jgi:chromosome segregation protein
MYLQQLVIQGLKSFASKSVLEFKPGITAIVGPNGSGKSNTADAVRWVLGEQSLKTLRGKKSEDVIFAGSDKKSRLGFCQVDMHLNNEDRQAPIDYGEIIITRKIYRDGEGEYFINKNKVRLQDILLLLAKSNFGQRSYSIISQGMVDLFLAATPNQRKEFFDEAAGVRQYQLKKEQAEHKLDLTRENLSQAELLIQEIEPRLRSLTRQVHRLEKREEVQAELKNVQHTYYTGQWHDLAAQHEVEEKKFHETDKKRETVTKELDTIQAHMHELALGTSRQEEYDKLQREYNQLSTEKNSLLRDQAIIKGKIAVSREQQGQYDLVWLERRKEQLQASISELDVSSAGHSGQAEKFSSHLAEKEKTFQVVSSEIQALSQSLQASRSRMANRKTVTIPEVAKSIDQLFTEQQELLNKIEQAQTLDELHAIKTTARAITSQLRHLAQKLRESGSGDPHEVIGLQDQIAKLLGHKETIATEINAIKIKLQVHQEKESLHRAQITNLTDELAKISRDLTRASSSKTASELSRDIANDEKEISQKINGIEAQLSKITEQIASFNQTEQKKKEEVFKQQNVFSQKQQALNIITAELNGIQISIAKIETHQEDLAKEMTDELTDDERARVKAGPAVPPEPQLFEQIQHLKKQIELIGGIDPQVAEEYKTTKERFDFLTTETADLNKAMADLESAIANLNETIKEQFGKAFEQINAQFGEYFKILFNGGHASLSLVKEEPKSPEEELKEMGEEEEDEEGDDNEDAEEEKKKNPLYTKKVEKIITGIDIHATPPGKKLRGISMLSGGERALTSIALICAIIHNNPSPFVILDEVDAALDESNSIRFASIVERLSKKTQFIVITHNRATMNKATIIYGVTMSNDGASKLLSIDMAEAEKVVNR